jgi:preprotein translocase subunit SecD
VLDGDIVESAPLIKQRISGGHASVTMGAGDAPEKQLHDAQELELVLRRGAYPAPLRLVSREAIHPAVR